MGYLDGEECKNREARIGKHIYKTALAHRRGFRDDQIQIDTEDPVWDEIFEEMGREALRSVNNELQDVSPETYAVGWDVLRRGRRNVPKLLGPGNGLREVFAAMLRYCLIGEKA